MSAVVSFPALPVSLVDRKCEATAADGTDGVVGGDLGCLLNIEGRLRRRGDTRTQVLHLAEVLVGDPAWAARAQLVAARSYELGCFLNEVLEAGTLPGECRRQRDLSRFVQGPARLGIKRQPRELLAQVRGLTLTEMQDCEECCGFGGAFALRFGDVSTAIVDRKCESIAAAGVDAVVGGDLGCLLNIEGRLRRRGDIRTQVLNLAEVLAGPAPQ